MEKLYQKTAEKTLAEYLKNSPRSDILFSL